MSKPKIVTQDSRRRSMTVRAILCLLATLGMELAILSWLGPRLIAASVNITRVWVLVAALAVVVVGALVTGLLARRTPDRLVEHLPGRGLERDQKRSARKLKARPWVKACRNARLAVERKVRPGRIEVAVPSVRNLRPSKPGLSANIVTLAGIAPDDVMAKADRIGSALGAPVRLAVTSSTTVEMTVRLRSPLTDAMVTGADFVARLLEGEHDARRLPYAVDEFGEDVVLEVALLPHTLIGGRTGAGKSACINSILSAAVTAQGVSSGLVLVDPKRTELAPWWPAAARVATEPDDLRVAVEQTVDVMRARYEWMERHRVRNLQEESEALEQLGGPLTVVIDELAEYMQVTGKAGGTALSSLAQLGRAAAIQLILATQTPRADMFSKSAGTETLKANLPNRISLATASSDDTAVILGRSAEADASSIPSSLPGAFYRTGGGQTLARCPLVTDKLVTDVVAAHPSERGLRELLWAASRGEKEGEEVHV